MIPLRVGVLGSRVTGHRTRPVEISILHFGARKSSPGDRSLPGSRSARHFFSSDFGASLRRRRWKFSKSSGIGYVRKKRKDVGRGGEKEVDED